jgi:hypothetical protein
MGGIRISPAGRTRCSWDYSNPATQDAMIGELTRIAGQCDGVRCDMAMLVLPEVFERTWGRRAPLFWPEATRRVRERAPGFRFMAEVYWDLEWTMLQQGFDYAYDKRLYDRLREGHARPVREHLQPASTIRTGWPLPGEPRRAAGGRDLRAEAARGRCQSYFLSPGLRFFHQGQFEGPEKRISPHLVARRWSRPTSAARFYGACSRCSASPRFATASGPARVRAGPGRGTGRGSASSPVL